MTPPLHHTLETDEDPHGARSSARMRPEMNHRVNKLPGKKAGKVVTHWVN